MNNLKFKLVFLDRVPSLNFKIIQTILKLNIVNIRRFELKVCYNINNYFSL